MFACLIVFIPVKRAYAQNHAFPVVQPLRLSSFAEADNSLYSFSTTRLTPVFTPYATDAWYSVSTRYSINGGQFEAMPSGINSPALLPTDILAAEYSGISGASIDYSSRPFTNGLRARFYTGSETGDPLIYKFTRSGKTENRNKIVPSGSVSGTFGGGKTMYRVSAGYYGFFSTGGNRNTIFRNLNPYYYYKINRQVSGVLEAVYNFCDSRKLFFYSGFKSYYGWDRPFYGNAWMHFRSYLYITRITYSYKNNYTLSVKYDGSVTSADEQEAVPEFGTGKNVFALYGAKYAESGGYNFGITVKAGYTFTSNLNNREYNLLKEDLSYFTGNIGINISKSFTNSFNAKAGFISGRMVGEHYYVDPTIKFTITPGNTHTITAGFEQNTISPRETELYGSLTVTGELAGSPLPVTVNGNTGLLPETKQVTSLSYGYENKGYISNITLFHETARNPVILDNVIPYRTDFPGDIYFSGNFINGKKVYATGAKIVQRLNLADSLYIICSGSRLFDRASGYIPRTTLKAMVSAGFGFGGRVTLEWNYRSETEWPEFCSNPDKYAKSGEDCNLTHFSAFNVYYSQRIKNFLRENNIKITLAMLNLLNRNNRLYPEGKIRKRAVILSIGFGI